jgi:hypothetical protein
VELDGLHQPQRLINAAANRLHRQQQQGQAAAAGASRTTMSKAMYGTKETFSVLLTESFLCSLLSYAVRVDQTLPIGAARAKLSKMLIKLVPCIMVQCDVSNNHQVAGDQLNDALRADDG